MVKEFRDFILRGNVVDLAVAVVIGAAFSGVVNSLVADIFTPLIAAVFGQPDFSRLDFSINESVFGYGAFINAVIAFLTVAAAIFFVVVKPRNLMQARAAKPTVEDATTTTTCPECLSTIPIGARRCSFCTTVLAEAAA